MSHIGRLRREDIRDGWYWVFANGILQVGAITEHKIQGLDTMCVQLVGEWEESPVHRWRDDELIFIQRIEQPTVEVKDGDYSG